MRRVLGAWALAASAAWLGGWGGWGGREAGGFAGAAVRAGTPLVAQTGAPDRRGETLEQRWYVIELGGQRAGHAHTVVTRAGEGDGARVRTESAMRIEIKRGPVSVPITVKSVWEETPDGRPLSLVSETALGAMPTTKKVTFGGAEMTIVTTVGAQATEAKRPLPEGAWLTPAAAEREVKRRLEAGEKTITLRTLEDEPGGALTVVGSTRRLVERVPLEVVGRTVPAIKWTVEIDRYAGVESVEYTDEEGGTLRSEMKMGGIVMVQVLADKDLAMRPLDAPELMVSTLVTPEGAVPAGAKRGTYVLSVADGEMPDLPATGAQVVERLDAKRVRVRVDASRGAAGGGGAGGAGGAGGGGGAAADPGTEAQYMGSSPMINLEDERIRALAREAGGIGDEPARKRALRLRAFVQKFIDEKALSVGFASASEVARTRTGDCTEHGVLLAALLRASGIPSRVVSGLIFVEEFGGKNGVFGYHMWAQAWLPTGEDGKGPPGWVDLDGTLRGGRVFGAGHIALGVSSLSDAEPQNFMVTLAPLLGRLRITVEETER